LDSAVFIFRRQVYTFVTLCRDVRDSDGQINDLTAVCSCRLLDCVDWLDVNCE